MAAAASPAGPPAETPDAAPGRRTTRTRDRALAVAGAVAAVLVLWVVGVPLLGLDLVVEQPGQAPLQITVVAVVVMSLVPALLGWALLAVLERFTRHARTVWTAAALVVLAVSFLPFLNATAGTGTLVVLALMHVAVAAVLIPVLWRTSAPRA
ncbi:DUF6069 family protein [Streptomonospora sp. S1-112]|uniref:DUF6069 family protein n=1 Tax=Streptomonospora mangrovi TaxID=2883123 RepID=A0A9X3NGA8_9ACTN|nr:DUF6069 family protein [Streptomonospora mangrovi]MDA0563032.1 DUF6069 family protein [Streptomonospora mangrovi]